jgi:predicted Zn-dependent protease
MKPVRTGRAPYPAQGKRAVFVVFLVVALSLSCLGQTSRAVAAPVQDTIEVPAPELVFPAVFPDLPEPVPDVPLPTYPGAWPDLPPPALNLPTLALARQLKKFDARHDLDKIGTRGMGDGLNFFSRDFEAKMGRDYAKQVEAEVRFLDDPSLKEYVNRVAQNIVSHSDAKLTFTVKVIDDSEINAFCLPGGFLYVNTGLLELADSEAALAGVIAHEVGHIAARHGARNQSRNILMRIALAAAAAALHGKNTAQISTVIAGNVAIPLAVLHFSREFEEEADLLALQYLYAAGYDPGAYVGFFEAVEKRRKSNKNFFVKLFSFHPPTSERIERCQRLLDAYFPDKSDYALNTDEFDNVKAQLSLLLGTRKVEPGKEEKEPVLQRRTPGPTQPPTPEPTPEGNQE